MKLLSILTDIWDSITFEARRIVHDNTVLLIFFIAPLLYPLVFCYMYSNENVENLPVAVVDEARCAESKRFIHKMEATPEITVAYRPATLHEAQHLMQQGDAHAIFYFPRDFATRLAEQHTAHVSVFADMSSFYYYKAALLGSNAVLIDEMHTIELERLSAQGLTGIDAEVQMQPVVFEEQRPFNPTGGYGSFFLPALMMLVLHQTLFLGICLLRGEAHEHGKNHYTVAHERSIPRVILGRAICYLLIYVPLCLLDLWLIPRWFHLPQLGNLYNIFIFILPYLLAIIYLGIAVGNLFVREKISPMLCFVFFSVILFFLTGMVWPQASMPRPLLWFSYIFPSTPGVQGFVKLSTMGAALADVRSEYLALWIQAGAYFVVACLSLLLVSRPSHTEKQAGAES